MLTLASISYIFKTFIKGAIIFIKTAVTFIRGAVTFIGKESSAIKGSFKTAKVRVNRRNLK